MATKTHGKTKTYEFTAYDPSKTYDEFQEHSLKLVRQGQEAVVEGVRAWSEALGSFAPAWQASGWPVRPEEAVDAVFDIAEQTLATQRQVARQVWGATASITEIAQQTQVTEAPAEHTDGQAKAKDYESMNVEQLQDEAAKAGIEGRSQMNKQELVKELRKQR